MKKRILIGALLLTLGFSNIFANYEETVNHQVMAAFKKEFVNAQDVKWENTKDFVKATFKLNDQVIFAYYSESGERLAISRNIVSNNLPLNLLADLKKNYSGYWISDLFEIVFNTDTSYYVTVQNAENTITLKANGGSWSVFKKDRKA